MRIGDLTFGLNEQAIKVLKMLSRVDIDLRGSFIDTSPWYNGRERGFCLSIHNHLIKDDDRAMHIAVFEHRNSDNICCLLWFTKSPYHNRPIADELTLEKAYKGGGKYDVAATFEYSQYSECVRWVIEKIKGFLCIVKMNENA